MRSLSSLLYAKRARIDPAKAKSHSPDVTNVTWDKQKVLDDLRSWDSTDKINWSKFARDHHVPGKNGGQVVKEFAKRNNIDVTQLDNKKPGTRQRARKLRLPGGDISVPTHRTITQVKEDWADMIKSGELTLGEPCNPFTITKHSTASGSLTATTSTVYGRKIPLQTIRQKLLERHEQYMYLHTDQELDNMSLDELKEQMKKRNIKLTETTTEPSIREKLKKSERTRTIAIWHDHSTLLGHGYILVTTKVFYDTAVFKYNRELPQENPVKDIQAHIEEPEVHILGMSSSSVEDQAAIIQDRISCLEHLHLPLTSSRGVPVSDRLLFFSGDKPAAQFERGCKQGGDYPCGTCGCHASRMDDLPYCLQLEWRNLEEMQAVATKGINHSPTHAHTKLLILYLVVPLCLIVQL